MVPIAMCRTNIQKKLEINCLVGLGDSFNLIEITFGDSNHRKLHYPCLCETTVKAMLGKKLIELSKINIEKLKKLYLSEFNMRE